MSEAAEYISPEEQALERIAALDLAAAEFTHAKLLAAETTREIAELGRTYQRFARSLRQSLALKARLRRERERAEAEYDDDDDYAPDRRPWVERQPEASPTAIRKRAVELRQAAMRVVWNEYEHNDFDEAALLLDELIGDEIMDPEFTADDLDTHVARACGMLRIPAAATRGWRDLPDPPAGAVPPGPFTRGLGDDSG